MKNADCSTAGRVRIQRALMAKAALAAAAGLTVPVTAFGNGIAYNFTGSTGASWNIAGNWTQVGVPSTHQIPGSYDEACLGASGTAATTVAFPTNLYSSSNVLGYLQIDGSDSGGSFTLTQSSSLTSMWANTEFIGFSEPNAAYIQTAGSNTAAVQLIIGSQAAGTCDYQLSGSTSTLAAGNETVGDDFYGTAVFNQLGGTNTVSNGVVSVGVSGSAYNNYYNLSGGTLNLNQSSQLVVTAGTFLQTTGTVVTFQASTGTGSLNVSGSGLSGTTAAYTMTGGTVTGTFVETIGSAGGGPGVFNQTGGSQVIGAAGSGGSLTLGGSGSSGTFLLSGTGTVAADSIFVGTGGTATFQQSGGTATVNSQLTIASGSSGTYNLSGGLLSVPGNAEVVYVAVNGGSGLLNVSNTGTFNVSSGQICVGYGASGNGGTGAVNQTGGNINAGAIYVADGTFGTFQQSGGAATVSGQLIIGAGGGTVGVGGGGVFNLSGSGLLTAGSVSVGQNPGPTGTGILNITGGTLNSISGAIDVGVGGTGTINQSGGTVNVRSLGLGFGSTGTYCLSAGGAASTLNVGAGGEIIGLYGNGTFQQSGGTHTVAGDLSVGLNAGGTGTYLLTGGLLTAQGNLFVGTLGGAGSCNQSGGTATVASTLYVGNGPGSVGSAVLSNTSGGTYLTASFVEIGCNGGSGSFVQNGGTFTASNGIIVGYNSSGSTYTMAGGTLNLPAGSLSVGYGTAAAAFNQTGGAILAPSGVSVEAGSAFSQQAGSITGSVYNLGLFDGTGNSSISGSLNIYAGGVATITGTLYVGGMTNQGVINVPNTGFLDQNSTGSPGVNQGQINVTGGQLYAYSTALTNDGTIAATGLVFFKYGISNYGTFQQGSGFLNLDLQAGPFLNYGAAQLASGQTLSLTGALNNSGSLLLQSGVIVPNGTAAVANLEGGTIYGPGVIATPFSNAGTITTTGGTLDITAAWTNAGVVQLNAVGAAVTGAAVTNTGTIQGFGNLGSNVTNTAGTIDAVGGTLVIGGTLTNPAGGTIAASTGNKVLVTSGLAANAGLITLTGGTYDNGGYPLLNTGQITGYGTLRTGGLTNQGLFTLSGSTTAGTTTVDGNVTNSAGYAINIRNQPAIFTGNVTNNGTITTYGTTVTFAGAYTGNNYVSDPSTNIFQNNVTVIPGGTMTGGTGDKYWFLSGSVTNSGTFTNGGTLICADNFTNSGAFSQTGPQNWSAGTVFTNTAGTAAFGADAGAAGANLTVAVTGGTVTFGSTQHLAGLSVAAGSAVVVTSGSTRSVVVIPTLNDAGTINLAAGDLDVTGSSLTAITALAAKGYNETGGANWGGPGITSSPAAADTAHLTAVGVIQNNQSGTAVYSPSRPFDGVAPGAGDILARYTWFGDANLDGKVDGSDYTLIDAGYAGGGSKTGWYNGDFNYDGVIDGSDYSLIDNDFNNQTTNLSTAAIVASAIALPDSLVTESPTAVPEPAMLLPLMVELLAATRRRRASRSPKPDRQ